MGAGGVLGCCSPSLCPLLASLLCSSPAEQQTLHLRLVFACLFLPSVLLLSPHPCISHQRGGGEQLQLLCGKTFRLWCSARDGAGWLMHHIPVCRRSSKPTLSSSTLDAIPRLRALLRSQLSPHNELFALHNSTVRLHPGGAGGITGTFSSIWRLNIYKVELQTELLQSQETQPDAWRH